ncbi:MAG: AMP-binding protein [Acidobacteriota bacterium]
MSLLLNTYHRLPYAAKVAAASLRGAILRERRYGANTGSWVAQALERESWSPQRWQQERELWLERTLAEARRSSRGHHLAAQGRDLHRLEEWPILTKGEVRRRPRALVPGGRLPRRALREHTSGSTGTPLVLWWSRNASHRWYALVEARMRRWNGVRLDEPWALIGGQLVAPVNRQRPPYWVWNLASKQLYLSAYHLRPGTATDYVRALAKHRVTHLLGYPSALADLAHFAQQEGASPPPMRVILSNAEPLTAERRQRIEGFFGCPVRDSYGLAEITAAASECEAGALHWWPEVGWLEVLDDDDLPVPPGQPGRLVATGLLNDAMPLVRYETGDRVRMTTDDEPPCPCGRRLPRLAAVEGRLDDVLVTPEGLRVGRLDPIFKSQLPIHGAQILQDRRDRAVLRLVPANGYRPQHGDELLQRLRQRLGNSMRLELELMERLPRTSAGKVRSVVRTFPLEDDPSSSPSSEGSDGASDGVSNGASNGAAKGA